MRKTAKAMALLTAASMIMTAFTPVYAESTDTEDTAAVDWENGENIKAIKEKGVITVATGTYVPFEYRDDEYLDRDHIEVHYFDYPKKGRDRSL